MSTEDTLNKFRGLPLRLARTERRLSQADLAIQAGVPKWRVVEAELDRLTLRADEVSAIEKVLKGENVQKVVRATRSDELVQRAFDEVDVALKGELNDEQRARLATKLIAVRRSLGIDVIKLVG